MRDHIESAYATLGLTHNASLSMVKREYKALVRKWHPDRFSNDPQGIAEATLMLRTVNHAYSAILEDRVAHAFAAGKRDVPSRTQVNRSSSSDSMTHAQMDEVIEAIRHSESLLAVVSDDGVSGWRSRAASLVLAFVYVVAGYNSGDAVRPLVVCLLPLLCIWFPDLLGGGVGGRITRPSPPSLVWFCGWLLLLMPALVLGFWWLQDIL